MESASTVELKRDCEATQIPVGTPVLLPAGALVDITQTLGGSFTVQTGGGLFRIASKDADALGLTPPSEDQGHGDSDGLVTEEMVWKTLKTCYDPEIPVNIVDLGLVYEMQIEPLAAGRSRVTVKMTLTAPGCGMGATIAGDAQQKLQDLPGVAEADVQIVWDPPWHHSRITPEGRAKLGLD
jgi:probable FeS assembly SUF system protein SufT